MNATFNSELPLVSIIVGTYNSSKYVIETLESAKSQTYGNIELIVTDDYSTDNTVDICIDWLSKNKERFVRTRMITINENSGTSPNCNRGIKASNGVWIKLIAGDDILLPNCISSNVLFSTQNNSSITISKINFFKDDIVLRKGECSLELKRFINKSQARKTKSYIRNPIFLNIPTIFLSKDLISKLDGFNENIRLLEDQPFILKVLLNSYNIHFLNETTVNYRIHKGSITGTGNIDFIKDLYKCYQSCRKPYLNIYNLIDLIFMIYLNIDFYFKLKGWVRTKFYRAFNKVTIIIRILS